MNMRELSSRIKSFFGGAPALEGQWRGPFSGIGHLGNSFQLSSLEDGWQRGLHLTDCNNNGTVMACIMTIARVLGASYPNHSRLTEKGGREIVTTSNAHRILMRPNSAQNVIDFVTHIVFNLMLSGNCYYFVKRNSRFEPVELIPLDSRQRRGFVTPDGELFYDISTHADFAKTKDFASLAPARDVFHVKLPSKNSVIHGDSPITYAYASVAVNNAVLNSNASFATNMNRPSGIISTEQTLTGAQMTELRAKFDEVSKGMNQGKIPILGNGMKFQQMSITSTDAQLLQTYNASVLDICRIFGVPIQLLGQENNGAASSVSALIGQFKTGSLLYLAELIEFALEELFKFDHHKNTIRFDLDNVARADFATEIDTLSKAVQNAVFAPNEARNRVGLDSVEYGDDPRIQAQNVRLQDAKPAPSNASAGKEPPETQSDEEDDGAIDDETAKQIALIQIRKAMVQG